MPPWYYWTGMVTAGEIKGTDLIDVRVRCADKEAARNIAVEVLHSHPGGSSAGEPASGVYHLPLIGLPPSGFQTAARAVMVDIQAPAAYE